jgi:hypothetical protein
VLRASSCVAVCRLALGLCFCLVRPAVSQTNPSDRWTLIGTTGTATNWLDTTTLVAQGKTRYAWTQLKFASPQTDNSESYDRMAFRTEYDCTKGEISVVQTVRYLRDSLVRMRSGADRQWTAPPPESIGELELAYVCGKLALPKPPRVVSGGPSPLQTSAWTHIERVGDSASGFLLSISKNKPSRKGPVAEAWFLQQFLGAQSDSSTATTYDATEVLEAYDCIRRQFQLRRLVHYLKGVRVEGWEYNSAEWQEIIPETNGETQLRFACRGH